VPVKSQDLDAQCYIPWSFLVFNCLRWKVIVRFVDLGEIAHCLNFLFIINEQDQLKLLKVGLHCINTTNSNLEFRLSWKHKFAWEPSFDHSHNVSIPYMLCGIYNDLYNFQSTRMQFWPWHLCQIPICSNSQQKLRYPHWRNSQSSSSSNSVGSEKTIEDDERQVMAAIAYHIYFFFI